MTTTVLRREANRMGWLTAGVLAGLIAAIVLAPNLAPQARAADETSTDQTISVTGTGRVLIKPDVADLSLGVSVVRAKAADAEAAAADAMAQVITALKAAGVADADIQTTSLSLQPVYDWSSNTQRLTGYQMDNQVNITVRDLTKVGTTLDAAVEVGATSVSGITFRVQDQTAAERDARTAAMTDARAKADTLAAAGGVTIVKVVSISEISSPVPGPIYWAETAARDGATTPVQPGNVAMEVTVTVVYGIG